MFRAFLLSVIVYFNVTPDLLANPGIECAEAGLKKGWYEENVKRLCSGATSTAPISCASAGLKRGWNQQFVVPLCSGAKSSSPINCAASGLDRGWNEHFVQSICAQRAALCE